MAFENVLAISGQSLATSKTSVIIDVRELEHISIQPIATGSSILGSIQLMASCNGTTFGAYGAAIALPAGNNIPVNIPTIGFGYVEVVFTAASGVGSLTVNVSGK